MPFLLLMLLINASSYEGYITFSGLKGPKVIIYKSCKVSESFNKAKFKKFCNDTKLLIRSQTKFCLRVTSTSKYKCENTLKQNIHSFTLKGKVITWIELGEVKNDDSKKVSNRCRGQDY